jgi:hypothetical protein
MGAGRWWAGWALGLPIISLDSPDRGAPLRVLSGFSGLNADDAARPGGGLPALLVRHPTDNARRTSLFHKKQLKIESCQPLSSFLLKSA